LNALEGENLLDGTDDKPENAKQQQGHTINTVARAIEQESSAWGKELVLFLFTMFPNIVYRGYLYLYGVDGVSF
jgi:hypothetical protein